MYKYGNVLSSERNPDEYVTSLCFELEPEFNDGALPGFEFWELIDYIAEKFLVVSAEGILDSESNFYYTEFSSPYIEDIREVRSIIGKHVLVKSREMVL
jgi:hypothetical protein